jgi:alanine racemase
MPADVTLQIDLAQVRENTQTIAAPVKVPLWAVIKADAYGLGAAGVAESIADLVEGFCVFCLREAIEVDLWNRTKKPAIALGPPDCQDPAQYVAHHVRPAVHTLEQAEVLKAARPILCVDTGMQRFACRPGWVDRVLAAGQCDEAFTHAVRVEQALQLVQIVGERLVRLHAAGSALLHEPAAWLDAVRPGMALYRGAVRASVPLYEVRQSRGPAGYGGFVTPAHGVILTGYSAGLRRGPCWIGGRPQQIIEVGMQSAYVTVTPDDRAGDPVVLLGDGLREEQLASAWDCTPQEALLRICRLAKH